jgi:hypothetical protein
MLRSYVNSQQTDWDELLYPLEFAVNNSKCEATGFAPFELNAGMLPLTPLNLDLPCKSRAAEQLIWSMRDNLRTAKIAIEAAQARYKHQADKHRLHAMFEEGQQVLLSTKNISSKLHGSKKLTPRWIGPFTITQIVSDLAYRLQLPEHIKIHDVFHISLLKPYHASDRHETPPPPEFIDDQLEYEVETILDHREIKKGRKKTRQYLIRWLGYGAEYDTWEPEENVSNCQELVQNYLNYKTNQANQKTS